MTDPAAPNGPSRPSDAPSPWVVWLATRFGTRIAAGAWWIVMFVFVSLIISWVGALVDAPSIGGAVFVVVATAVVAVPLVREGRHTVRMAQMLVFGT